MQGKHGALTTGPSGISQQFFFMLMDSVGQGYEKSTDCSSSTPQRLGLLLGWPEQLMWEPRWLLPSHIWAQMAKERDQLGLSPGGLPRAPRSGTSGGRPASKVAPRASVPGNQVKLPGLYGPALEVTACHLCHTPLMEAITNPPDSRRGKEDMEPTSWGEKHQRTWGSVVKPT